MLRDINTGHLHVRKKRKKENGELKAGKGRKMLFGWQLVAVSSCMRKSRTRWAIHVATSLPEIDLVRFNANMMEQLRIFLFSSHLSLVHQVDCEKDHEYRVIIGGEVKSIFSSLLYSYNPEVSYMIERGHHRFFHLGGCRSFYSCSYWCQRSFK